MNNQQAFKDMSDDRLRQIIVDVQNQKDPHYSTFESAVIELQRRHSKDGQVIAQEISKEVTK